MLIQILILNNITFDYPVVIRVLKNWGTSNNIKINYTLYNSNALYASINILKNYDLLIADTELKSDIHFKDCIELYAYIRKSGINIPVIFFSTTLKYALDAFDVNAFNYILLPLNNERLYMCMNKLKDLLTSKNYYIHHNSTTLKISYINIVCVVKSGHAVLIQTTTETHSQRNTLDNIECFLPNYFIRCHKSCIVNVNHIKEIENNTIILDTNQTQIIGRSYLNHVKNYMRTINMPDISKLYSSHPFSKVTQIPGYLP